MKIAINYPDARVGSDGHVADHDAGSTLVRRLLRIFPGSALIGDVPRSCVGFAVRPLELVDPSETVVINMAALESTSIWRTLARSGREPKIMNFVWKNASNLNHPVERAGIALSCALFPTFANSERTAGEVQEMIDRWTIPAIAEKAEVSWVNLGIRLDHVLPRRDPDVPVVLYPAIYLSERKQPQVFLDVVERLARRTPLRVEARLHESHLASEAAMRLSLRSWAWVGPLTATREDYWAALARTTAFLATATDESYGLEYIEALVAGAVGVLPDRPWARAILPAGYPFLYGTTAEAEAMLLRAVTEPDVCRREADAAAGGSFAQWLRARHSDDRFDAAIVEQVERWFGA
ncbi:glycosyltransferase [Cellulomonas sp. Leaf395]|uniref:glycosyltransferase n=1 Tax=Cellulomonas sp. Leaf395 TaxID=1736362 RepID=UPI0006F3AFF9|nr:glycosyltransferase [Cellulomonas sp. Leaf395]KQS95796.1 hypothetical protein ASG23_19265 [Cellulomonas sp. Leaf395]